MSQNRLSYDNPFEIITTDTQEAKDFSIRADLMLEIRDMIEDIGLNNTEVATFLGITYSQACDLLHGKFRKFSADALLRHTKIIESIYATKQ